MKPGLSQSMRSIRTVHTMKSTGSDFDIPRVLDFDEYMVTACKKFPFPYPIVVRKDIQSDDPYKPSRRSEYTKPNKVNIVTQFVNDALLDELKKGEACTHPSIAPPMTLVDEKSIVIGVIYNNMNQIIEIQLHKAKYLPRELIQLIGLIAPQYEQLAKISITTSRVDVFTIYELNKKLPLSHITDVCLDQSHLPEANYAILLNTPRLNTLSLSRCLLNDDVCEQLASKLYYGAPAETGLVGLNLSSNLITDVGAKYMADALKTNRHLRYLNLAGNCISDEGALDILATLMDFPLTYDEIIKKRRRYFEYLKAKKTLLYKYFTEWECKSGDESQSSKKFMPKKRKNSSTSLKNKSIAKKDKPTQQSFTDDYVFCRADLLAGEMIGPFLDPFGPNFSKIKNNHVYCTGNLCLCYLNLSYNNLTYQSLKRLHNVVQYQSGIRRKGQQGLIRVVIEGNLMPVTSPEFRAITEILNKNISTFGSKHHSELGKRTSKTMTRVSVLPEKSTMAS